MRKPETISINDLYFLIKDKLDASLSVTREIPGIGIKPREALGVFLIALCMQHNFSLHRSEDYNLLKIEILKNNIEGDGTLIVTHPKTEWMAARVEQVMAFDRERNWDVTDLIIKRIKKKHAKGLEYCRGNALCIFSEYGGEINIVKIKSFLRNEGEMFEYYFIFARQQEIPGSNILVYGLIDIRTEIEGHMRYKVWINTEKDIYFPRQDK